VAAGTLLVEVVLPRRAADWRVLFKKVGKRRTDAQAMLSAAFSPVCACFSGIAQQPAFAPRLPVHSDELFAQMLYVELKAVCADEVIVQMAVALATRYREGIDVSLSTVRQPGRRLLWTQNGGDLTEAAVPSSEPSMYAQHTSLVLGRTPFVADEHVPPNCLHAAFVLCTLGARVTKLRLDAATALLLPGVAGIVTGHDFSASRRKIGTVVLDEEPLAADDTFYFGQPVALVLASSADVARKAASAVIVEGEVLPAVHGIVAALEQQSFFEQLPERVLCRDGTAYQASSTTSNAANKVEPLEALQLSGTVSVKGQDHLYLEPQAVFVDASDLEAVTCRASCQNPARVQWAISYVLGVPMSAVRCVVKRIGGGFGGKQDRPQFLAAAAAIASRKARRPVLLVLDREVRA
jgi:hypothetical protein